MILEVLICTINSRIARLPAILQPPRPDVAYLIAWQHTTTPQAPPRALTSRPDVRIINVEGRGLSANRNAALRAAHGKLLLIADDDVVYTPTAFDTIQQAFNSHQADIICFQALNQDNQPLKPYSPNPFDYAHRPRGTYFTSFEIALRANPHLPQFDTRFGIAAPYLAAAEEEIFLHQAHRQGLKIIYLPQPILTTNSHTTGTHYPQEPALWRTKGAALTIMHGPLGARLRSLKDALLRPHLTHRLSVFREMLRGIRYIQSGITPSSLPTPHSSLLTPHSSLPTPPTFTLIVPFHNRPALFAKTLQTIANQTYRPLQLILVDNNSDAPAHNLAHQFQAAHQAPDFNIQILSCATPGAAAARNHGLNAATGQYTYFFDSDDLLDPQFFHHAAAHLAHQELDLLACQTTMLLPNHRRRTRSYTHRLTPATQILTGQLSTQSMLFLTSFLRQIGGWDDALPVHNDWELGLRAILAHPRAQWLATRPYHTIISHSDTITAQHNTPDLAHELFLPLRKAHTLTNHPALYLRTALVAARTKQPIPHDLQPNNCSLPIRLATKLIYTLTRLHFPQTWRLAMALSPTL